MAACTGQYQQYATMQECLTACQYIPVVDASAGNTLMCHFTHAGYAAGNPDAGLGPNPHCWHAGPFGWGACGSQCEDFCTIATTYCTPDAGFAPDSGAPPYSSFTACTTACPGFAGIGDSGTAIVLTDSGSTSSYTSNGPASGNTRDCREYHLGAALTSPANQQIHCPHPAVASGVCF